jgi:hypothetical protein
MRLKTLMLIACVLLLGTIVLLGLWMKRYRASEKLFLWGLHEGKCLMWLIEPTKQRYREIDAEFDECNFTVMSMNGEEHLVYVQPHSGTITTYTVSGSRVSQQQVISTGQITITSQPQWSLAGLIYLSAILDHQEQIYVIDPKAGEVVPLFIPSKGIVSDVVLSPNGQYLAYLLNDTITNRNDCSPDGCGGIYHILNITTKMDNALSPSNDVNYPETTCGHHSLSWSPMSGSVAFIAECASGKSIEVFKIEQTETLASIKPISIPSLTIEGWLNEEELVYETPTDFALGALGELYFPIPRYYLYSIKTQSNRNLADFPLLRSTGERFILTNIDWTIDGRQLVGIVVGENSGENNLAIVNIGGDIYQFDYKELSFPQPVIQPWDLYRADPAWSPSTQWIAYSSSGGTVSFVNSVDGTIYSVPLPSDLAYEFTWLSP